MIGGHLSTAPNIYFSKIKTVAESYAPQVI